MLVGTKITYKPPGTPAARIYICVYILFFSIPFIIFALLSLLVVTQIRGHLAGSSPPLPTTVRALHFYREKLSALSSLVHSRRIIVLTHARRSQQLILFFSSFFSFFSFSFFLQINSKSRHGGNRTTSRTKTINNSIRGLPLDRLVHRGDRPYTRYVPINTYCRYLVRNFPSSPFISLLGNLLKRCACSSHYTAVISTRRHPANPVSALVLRPR